MQSKIVLVLANLNAGGAQHVMLNLANGLSVSVDVILALVQPIGELVQQVSPTVRIVHLGGRRKWFGRLIYLIWKERPQAVLSTLSDINIGILLIKKFFPSNVRVVVRETLMPDCWITYWSYPILMKALYRYTHSRAEYIIVLSQSMQQRFIHFTDSFYPKIVVISNGVDSNRFSAPLMPISIDIRKPYLIAVGRLSPQKGFDILIKAFAQIATTFYSYQLVIVGEGEERTKLETLIDKSCLNNRVILTGFVANPLPLVRQSMLFVLSSYVEGMPNVLIEALCVGTPALATQENTSADEILTEGGNGFLVKRCEVGLLADGLQRALAIAPHLDRQSIMEQALKRFSINTMIEAYRKVLID